MARLSRPGWLWLNTKIVYPLTVTHPSTNRARRRATTLIKTKDKVLPQSQAATLKQGLITETENINDSECRQAVQLQKHNSEKATKKLYGE